MPVLRTFASLIEAVARRLPDKRRPPVGLRNDERRILGKLPADIAGKVTDGDAAGLSRIE